VDLEGDPVETMVTVPPEITPKMIPHVDQLLRNHNFTGIAVGRIETVEMDKHTVVTGTRMHRVRTADTPRDFPANPPFESHPVSRDIHVVARETEFLQIHFHQPGDSRIARFDMHETAGSFP
jgi:hypothetical protein